LSLHTNSGGLHKISADIRLNKIWLSPIGCGFNDYVTLWSIDGTLINFGLRFVMFLLEMPLQKTQKVAFFGFSKKT